MSRKLNKDLDGLKSKLKDQTRANTELRVELKEQTRINNEFSQSYRKRNIDKLDQRVVDLGIDVSSLKIELSLAKNNLSSNDQQELSSLRYSVLTLEEEKETLLLNFRKKERTLKGENLSLKNRVQNLEVELSILKEEEGTL